MTRHDRDLCGLFAGLANIELTDELKALEPESALLGFATHARPGAQGFDYRHSDTYGCPLCALGSFRKAHPRKRKAWAVYIETTGAHRMFSRKVDLLAPPADQTK